MKSKYLRLYEKLCPDDILADVDLRTSAIIAEMRAVIAAKDNKEAVKAVEWWGWDSNQQAVAFVVRARKMWAAMK